MMGERVRIRKISTEALRDLMVMLFDKGVDFIDLEGILHPEEDKLGVSFCKEYMDPEFAHTFDDIDSEDLTEETNEDIDIKLSDEDLNQLI